jgi:hypothetical protein
VALPELVGATNGAVYGACELVVRTLNTNRDACRLELVSVGASSVVFTTSAQVGVTLVDTLETRTASADGAWSGVAAFTNTVVPDAVNFESGWQELTYVVNASALPPASQRFFRLARTWLPE